MLPTTVNETLISRLHIRERRAFLTKVNLDDALTGVVLAANRSL